MKLSHVHALVAPALFALACSSTDEIDEDGGANVPPEPVYVGHPGVTVQGVAIYQGVKRTLAEGGQPVASEVPLVAGRDALVRVFYSAAADAVGKPVLGRLALEGADPIESEAALVGQSIDPDLASTVNFIVPGDSVGETFSYRISLLEEAEDPSAPDNQAAHHPGEGFEAHAVEGPRNTLRVILAPFRYDADGSGRLPDLSPERIEQYRTRFLQLYPVSNVEVTVREPTPWSQPINPDGSGWQEVGITTFGFRSQDGAPADVYYYAVFNPREDIYDFCSLGCLLGVTLLNDQPADVGNPSLRIALGVGFDQVALDTAAHEIGHAHGRPHAPCGNPMGVDPSYPYANASIGVWGWDIVGHTLIDPSTHTDVMGYCDAQWISDYNYGWLLFRGMNVNLPKVAGPMGVRSSYELVTVDGDGKTTWRAQVKSVPSGAAGMAVDLALEDGTTTRVEGHFYRYDHLPGGWLLFPAADARAVRASAAVDGRTVVATRP